MAAEHVVKEAAAEEKEEATAAAAFLLAIIRALFDKLFFNLYSQILFIDSLRITVQCNVHNGILQFEIKLCYSGNLSKLIDIVDDDDVGNIRRFYKPHAYLMELYARRRSRRQCRPPDTSGDLWRSSPTSPKPSATALPLCGRPELVRAKTEPPRPPHDAAAHGGVHHDTLGLRQRIDVAPTSSGRRLAAGALEPESSLADWITAAAPPVASRRWPTLALDPIDRPRSSPAGALAVRPPPASPSSALAGKQSRSFAEVRVARALAAVVGIAPKGEHGLQHAEACQRVSRFG
uniref:Uncharacterized protein n=1 Tax=Ananas comosus var. bracteatus TaxID=296719 RepID=A0A6V7NP71_ANACO|nr:unnamed protein product [Ananas comosus var. bracteatus]